ncbi:hypothetical protein NPIL_444431 [Nephila pilipes]|uniref:Uncharacterized protein n=1 Tax=Nephila pilipes TaxID=299642 RepID=A0A8X6MM17_NEPPI|nr:hypothetical protein NPIL_444431 [Nephila pilipes]
MKEKKKKNCGISRYICRKCGEKKRKGRKRLTAKDKSEALALDHGYYALLSLEVCQADPGGMEFVVPEPPLDKISSERKYFPRTPGPSLSPLRAITRSKKI